MSPSCRGSRTLWCAKSQTPCLLHTMIRCSNRRSGVSSLGVSRASPYTAYNSTDILQPRCYCVVGTASCSCADSWYSTILWRRLYHSHRPPLLHWRCRHRRLDISIRNECRLHTSSAGQHDRCRAPTSHYRVETRVVGLVQLHRTHLGAEVLHVVLLWSVDRRLEHADLRPLPYRRHVCVVRRRLFDNHLRLSAGAQELADHAESGTPLYSELPCITINLGS